MFAYVIRRALYAIPILIGVNLITFVLFFVVNTPDDMARMHLGMKRVTADAIEKWKAEHGYDRPLLFNAEAEGAEQVTGTIFFDKSVRLFAFDFGSSDAGRDIGQDISQRMWPSLAIALPTFLIGLLVYLASFFVGPRAAVVPVALSAATAAILLIALPGEDASLVELDRGAVGAPGGPRTKGAAALHVFRQAGDGVLQASVVRTVDRRAGPSPGQAGGGPPHGAARRPARFAMTSTRCCLNFSGILLDGH